MERPCKTHEGCQVNSISFHNCIYRLTRISAAFLDLWPSAQSTESHPSLVGSGDEGRSYSRAVHNQNSSSDSTIAQSHHIYSDINVKKNEHDALKTFGFYSVYSTNSTGR